MRIEPRAARDGRMPLVVLTDASADPESELVVLPTPAARALARDILEACSDAERWAAGPEEPAST